MSIWRYQKVTKKKIVERKNFVIISLKNYKFQLLIIIQKVKKELRNEKLLILFILNLLSFRSDTDLENILGM